MAARVSIFFTALLSFLLFAQSPAWGLAARLRCMWRDDPATTMVIGWDQVRGSNPLFFYDTQDGGRLTQKYQFKQRPDRIVEAKGMNNHFVRLTGLRPNTTYYFVILDSEGVSRRYAFTTAPARPEGRLSLIAGGDSRNYRQARRNANLLVGKLRPHAVLFGGDMTGGDTAGEWIEWLDDWQTHITDEGHLTPIIVARGNHEYTNESVTELFDLPHPQVYYAFSLGGTLLRVYTLNTMIASGGAQKAWLEEDLKAHRHMHWRMAHYHHPMRPHTSRKPEKDELYFNWASLFFEHRMDLVVECDAHVVKTTWPIAPSRNSRAEQGFVRDDARGTVYVGEGGWGAPLRQPDDPKAWTRSLGSFNQFKWIFVDLQKIEVRIVQTDGAERVASVRPENRFTPPMGLNIWSPAQGDVVVIPSRDQSYAAAVPAAPPLEVQGFSASNTGQGIVLDWTSNNEQAPLQYHIQRKLGSQPTFETIFSMQAKGGPDNAYTYRDLQVRQINPEVEITYRLNCLLPDGSVLQYTSKVESRAGKPAGPAMRLEPIAGTSMVRVPFRLQAPANVEVLIQDVFHKEVKRIQLPALEKGEHKKALQFGDLPPGKYLIEVLVRDQTIATYPYQR